MGSATTTGTARAFVGLGANLGEPRRAIAGAIRAIAALPDTCLVAVSSLYRSAPVDAAGPDFLNAVAQISTSLEPLALLRELQAIEQGEGRERPYRNAPRTLDLDLLLWGDLECRTPTLTLPHPRLHLRGFVLEPLSELAPTLEIPGLGLLSAWRARAAGQAVQRCP